MERATWPLHRALAVAGLLAVAGATGSVATSVQAHQPARALPDGLAANERTTTAPTAGAAEIPPDQVAVMQRVSGETGIPWQVLAAIAKVESDFGRNMATSSAGAVGYGQFLPSTWAAFGQGGDPYDHRDVIPAMARYLLAFGAPADLRRAVYAYNHSWDYVDDVLALAAAYGANGGAPPTPSSAAAASGDGRTPPAVVTAAPAPTTERQVWPPRPWVTGRAATPKEIASEGRKPCGSGRAAAGLRGAVRR